MALTLCFSAAPIDLIGQVRPAGTPPSIETSAVVLCDPRDPYYKLAIEIAGAESVPCYGDIDRALGADTRFLLWVGSPQFFSGKILAQFGAVHTSRHSRTSVGIISGGSVDEARTLWKRAKDAGGGRILAVIVSGHAPVGRGRVSTPTLIGLAAKRNPGKDELRVLLANADYLSIRAPGDVSFWQLSDGAKFTAADLPQLPAMVLATSGSQSLPFGGGGSIALAAARNGAAAFTGSLGRPVEEFLIGGLDGLPLRYAWPGATIGEVIQLQSRGEIKGITAFPCYWLLGDPRIALQPDAAWAPLNIETTRSVRTLNFGETPPGFFPLRIRNGARYPYIEVPNVTAASDGDLFYNARLQMMNTGADKILLVLHPGGELKISMRTVPPRLWRFRRALLDAADMTLIFIWSAWTRWLSTAVGGLALISIVALIRTLRPAKRILIRSILIGAGMGMGHMTYALLRIGSVSMTSRILNVGSTDVLATALVATAATLLSAGAGSFAGKMGGIAAAAAPGLAATITSAATISFSNLFRARPAYGTGIYNYSLTWMALIGSSCECAAFLLLFLLTSRMGTRHGTGKLSK